jgi:hypothetical protein
MKPRTEGKILYCLVWAIAQLGAGGGSYKREIRNGENDACEPGRPVSVVSGYGEDDWAIEVRSSAEAKGYFL